MKKKGFTLIELLAVIVVLGIILSIAVPSITGIIKRSSMSAFESDAKLVLKAVDYKKIEDISFNPNSVNQNNIGEYLGLSNANYSSLSITLQDNVPVISIIGKGKWDGLIACGSFHNMKVVESASDCSDDNVSPIVTLNGYSPVSMYIGESYSDAGATATDNLDGDMTSKIVTTSDLDINLPGEYTITYAATDSAGNTSTLTRTVTVMDNVPPVIAFDPNGNSTYAKSRSTTVTVSDASIDSSSLKYQWTTSTTVPSEASFTISFTNGEAINSPSGVTGSYYLWVLAKDISNNKTIISSNVFNLDNTPPVIAMNGSSPLTISKGNTYSDAGATATDNIDTSVTVTSTGTVNPSIVGSYNITYNATDSSGNAATPVTRTINVVDVSAPVITINGSNPVTINIGSNYSDAGATAIDDVDGDVTSKITTTSNVNPNSVGTYAVTYTVSDTAGNTADATRTVNVIDNIIPTVAFNPNGNTTYAKSRSTTVTVSDNVSVNTSSLKYQWSTSTTAPAEGSFTSTFTNGGTISSPAGLTGSYYLWILAKDTSGNTMIARSNVFNLDNIIPIITLSGSSPVTVEAGSAYSDAGSTATDNIDGNITSSITTTSTVNTAVLGTYTVTYNVSDSSGNPASTVTRTVNVVDTVIPTVAFNPNGNSTYAKGRSTTVTASDTYSGVNTSSLKYQWTTSTTAPTEGSFTTTFTNGGTISSPAGVTGSYYLWILAKDTSGNTTIIRSNVFNLDNNPPVITMNGTSPLTISKGSTYSDAGATAADNIDASLIVSSSGTVNPSIVGTYTITYNATDSSGNAATPVTRTINVIDVSAPVITINGSNPVTINAGTTYSDAGSSATDDVDGNVTSKINTTSNVNPNVLGTYTVTYTVSDNAGNTATSTRTVNVVDSNPPIVTANSASYTITQGNSNAIPGLYFTINQNGLASISSTTCIDTTNGNVTVTNTGALAVGTHTIKCTATKTTGLSAYASTNIVVNPAYTCSSGTLTYDATYGYICTISSSSQSWYTTNYVCTTCNSCTYTYTQYVYGGQSCTYCGGGQTVISQVGLGGRYYSTSDQSYGTQPSIGDVYTGQSWTTCSYCAGGCSGCGQANCGSLYVCWVGNVNTTVTPCNTCDYNYQVTATGTNDCDHCGCQSGYNQTNYYCGSGWSTYSGSGSGLVCYKAATQQ